MMAALRRVCASSMALVAIALVSHSEGRAVEAVPTVPAQVAAAMHIQHWGQILWGLVTSQTGTEVPSFGDPIFNDDGSVSQSFTTADGTEAVLTAFLDGSARIDIVLPDNASQTVLQSAPIFDGVSVTTIAWNITSSEGLSVEYTSVIDDQETIFDISDDTTELVGSAVLPGGLTQEFEVLTAGGVTEVQSSHSDGSTITLRVPLMAPDFMYPDPVQDTTGTYTDPSGSIHFVLSATPKDTARWAALVYDLGEATKGTYSLHADFSGFGQLTESDGTNDELVALVTWTQEGDSHVYLLNGQDRHVGPAGAALDYLQNRWLTLTALLAPAPGVGASGLPSVLLNALRRPCFFSDVPLNYWAYTDIEKAANAGIVGGYPDRSYHPEELVSRAQLAVYISRALAGGDENVPAPDSYREPSFDDVGRDYWAYRYIEYALVSDVIRGYGDGSYRPEDTLSRDQLAVYVARSKGWIGIEDDMSTAPEIFPDVPAGFWAGTAIQACVANNVVIGYDDGCYRPEGTVTRDQMAVYVARAFDLP